MNPTPTLGAKVAAEVRAELARQRVSVVELSARTGMAYHYLRARLNGVTRLDVDDLDTIALALGVAPASLIPAEDGAA